MPTKTVLLCKVRHSRRPCNQPLALESTHPDGSRTFICAGGHRTTYSASYCQRFGFSDVQPEMVNLPRKCPVCGASANRAQMEAGLTITCGQCGSYLELDEHGNLVSVESLA